MAKDAFTDFHIVETDKTYGMLQQPCNLTCDLDDKTPSLRLVILRKWVRRVLRYWWFLFVVFRLTFLSWSLLG